MRNSDRDDAWTRRGESRDLSALPFDDPAYARPAYPGQEYDQRYYPSYEQPYDPRYDPSYEQPYEQPYDPRYDQPGSFFEDTYDRHDEAAGRRRHRRRAGPDQPGRGRADKGRGRADKGTKKRKGGRRGRSLVAFVVVLVVLGGLGYGGWRAVEWVQDTLTTPDYTGEGVGVVTIEVKAGQSLTEIAQTLHEADVVASPQAFIDASQANPLSANIQPGFYELPQQLPAATAVELLLDLDNRLVAQVTIPEGLTSFRIFSLLAEELDLPEEDLVEATEDPLALGIPDWWFERTDGQEVDPTIEGFLFPSTYDFPPDPTADQVVETMVQQFLTVADDLDFVSVVEDERNISPYEALIVASLAQAEAGVEEDLGKVARVAYNRLYVQGMPLEFDVTVNYWLELNGADPKPSAELTEAELTDPDNPYRRTLDGLVPTPINSPGEAAMAAAMDPPPGDWLYFVAIDDEGNSAFAETLAEHCQNVETAIQAGILTESC